MILMGTHHYLFAMSTNGSTRRESWFKLCTVGENDPFEQSTNYSQWVTPVGVLAVESDVWVEQAYKDLCVSCTVPL